MALYRSAKTRFAVATLLFLAAEGAKLAEYFFAIQDFAALDFGICHGEQLLQHARLKISGPLLLIEECQARPDHVVRARVAALPHPFFNQPQCLWRQPKAHLVLPSTLDH